MGWGGEVNREDEEKGRREDGPEPGLGSGSGKEQGHLPLSWRAGKEM